MSTTKEIPAGVLRALGLHKGDFLMVKDESADTFVVEITTAVDRDSPPLSKDDIRRAALARFATGAFVGQPASQEELDEARSRDLRAKHVK
jgi:bifunctional DNA-binding transcriptional regulator/antitoxin component of YhaV-PrlF toxin-antitoxin module